MQYNLSGALYPWTGARFGNCTGVGPVSIHHTTSLISG